MATELTSICIYTCVHTDTHCYACINAGRQACTHANTHTHTHTHTASIDEGVRSHRSVALQLHLQDNGVRVFEMTAIEHDGGSKTATDGTLSVKILHTMLTHAQLLTQRQRETVFL